MSRRWRIRLKLALITGLIAVLAVFTSGRVDFVYTGF